MRTRFFLVLLLLAAIMSLAVFQLTDKTFLADVYVWFPDGQTRQVSPAASGIFYEPHIHPQGTHVVFFGNTSGPPRIWKTDLSTFGTVALTPEEYGARHPSFSWDGTRIVFASDMKSGQPPERIEHMGRNGVPPKDLVTNLFVMDADGHNIRQITFGAFRDQRPCFSPDGKLIAFVSNRGGGTHLWVVDVNGESEPLQLQIDGYGYRPCFSVDGKWVFFFTKAKGRHRIAKIPIKGGSITLLANDTIGNSHGPFADPNGKVLLMHSYRDGKYSIWELPLDGAPAHIMQPPGFGAATHATRSENGIMAFDVARSKWFLRRTAKRLKRMVN